MTTVLIFVICVLIFVCVSVVTAILVYKSQMRKKSFSGTAGSRHRIPSRYRISRDCDI